MSIGGPSRGDMGGQLTAYGRPPSGMTSIRGGVGRQRGMVTWLILVCILLPATMTVYLGNAKFTPGRIAICIFLIPAVLELFKKTRRLLPADALACLASAWLIGATFSADPEAMSSAVAMVLEFLGAYLVARAFFFGEPALRTFVHVLKIIVTVVVLLAILDHLAQRIVTYNAIAALWGLPTFQVEYRYGLLRAFSTFPHPILYGTFCTVSGAILLYAERNVSSRILWTGWCFLGCILAMSSAPLISFMIVFSTYAYDRLMRQYSWRWLALIVSLCIFLAIVMLLTNKPVSWIISNLTLDPSTGYFRVATWDTSFFYIGLSPFTGYGFREYANPDDYFGNASVDSVWLSLALRFGVPAVTLIILTNAAAFFRSGPTSGRQTGNSYMNHMRTGFTLVLVVYMFAGLTVHYWNSIWVFWGICIGLRTSLQEEYFRSGAALVRGGHGRRLARSAAPRFGYAIGGSAWGGRIQSASRPPL